MHRAAKFVGMTRDHPPDEWFLHFVDDICAVFPDFFLKGRSEGALSGELNQLYLDHIEKDVS